MGLDIRFPVGFMFTLAGAILVVYGMISDPSIYGRSLGININLLWGSVLLGFGLVMLWIARRAGRGTRS